jgi:group I intron endonuclease
MENNNVSLYTHTRKNDNVIFYVGIGVKRRPYSKRDRNQHWNNTVNKHGYEVNILSDGLSWDRACELEKIMISFYGRQDKKLGTLVNQTDGGDGYCGGIAWNKGMSPSKEVVYKISQSLKGKMVGDKNPWFGKTHKVETIDKMKESAKHRPEQSDETRRKRSESLKGHKNTLGIKHTEKSIETFRYNNPRNKKVEVDGVVYRSVRECARQLNIPHGTIRKRFNNSKYPNYCYV